MSRQQLRTRPSPFSEMTVITLNGSAQAILSASRLSMTSQSLDVSQAHKIGLFYTVTATGNGAVDMTISLEGSFGAGQPFHVMNGEAASSAAQDITEVDVAIGRRFVWWNITAPVARFRINTANLAGADTVTLNGMNAWTQS